MFVIGQVCYNLCLVFIEPSNGFMPGASRARVVCYKLWQESDILHSVNVRYGSPSLYYLTKTAYYTPVCMGACRTENWSWSLLHSSIYGWVYNKNVRDRGVCYIKKTIYHSNNDTLIMALYIMEIMKIGRDILWKLWKLGLDGNV